MQHSNLQRILAELGITPVYEYNGRTFYDTKDVFDRHNFARDVKRNVEEDDWVLEKTKYYLSERGIVSFAFKKGVTPVRLAPPSVPLSPPDSPPPPPPTLRPPPSYLCRFYVLMSLALLDRVRTSGLQCEALYPTFVAGP